VTDQIKSFFPNLKNVIRVGTGLDNVDLAFCKREGIAVYSAAGANADAVAEYVVSVMLLVLRRLYQLTEQDAIDWNRLKFLGASMSEQTIGLVGFGNIGKLLHKKLSGFSYKTFFVYDPYINPVDAPEGVTVVTSIEELMKQSTIVSLHLPLTEETRNIINKDKLRLLAKDAILINSSRGGIVDELAVLELLNASAQFVYVADTVIDEPHGNRELFGHERVIVTPHIASLTTQANVQMTEVALDNFLSNKPVHLA
jgi:phosphoglycerate dehydrogenase-like enzyme